MSPNLVLVAVAGVLIAAGVYLLLERSLTRILIGVLLASNGVNVLFLVVSGVAGGAPIIGITPKEDMSDPLPQAMVLTAIVITLGVTAYLLTLAYRSFQLNGNDEVADDVEDAAIRQLADADLVSDSYDEADEGAPDEIGVGTIDQEGERIREEDEALRQAQDAGGQAQDAEGRAQDAGGRAQHAGGRAQDAGGQAQDAGGQAQDAHALPPEPVEGRST